MSDRRYEISYKVKEVLAQLEQIHVHTNISFQDSLNTTNSLLSAIKQRIGGSSADAMSIDGKLNLDTSQVETVFKSLASSAADDSQTISSNFGEVRGFSAEVLDDSKELTKLLKSFSESEAQQLYLKRQVLQEEKEALERIAQKRKSELDNNFKQTRKDAIAEQTKLQQEIKAEAKYKREVNKNFTEQQKQFQDVVKFGTKELKKLKTSLGDLTKDKTTVAKLLKQTNKQEDPEYHASLVAGQKEIYTRASSIKQLISTLEKRLLDIDVVRRDESRLKNLQDRSNNRESSLEGRLNNLQKALNVDSNSPKTQEQLDRLIQAISGADGLRDRVQTARSISGVTLPDRTDIARNMPAMLSAEIARLAITLDKFVIPQNNRTVTGGIPNSEVEIPWGKRSEGNDRQLEELKNTQQQQIESLDSLLRTIKEAAKVEKEKNEANLEQLKLLKSAQDKLTAASKEADNNVTKAAESLQQLLKNNAPTAAISLAGETLRSAAEYSNTVKQNLEQVTTYSNTTSEDFKTVANSSAEAKGSMDSLANELKKAVGEVAKIDNRFAASEAVIDRAQKTVRQFADVLVAFHTAFNAEKERQPNLKPVELAIAFPTLDGFIAEINNTQTSLSNAIDLVKQSVKEFRTEAAKPIEKSKKEAVSPVEDRSAAAFKAVVTEFEKLLPVASHIVSSFQSLEKLGNSVATNFENAVGEAVKKVKAQLDFTKEIDEIKSRVLGIEIKLDSDRISTIINTSIQSALNNLDFNLTPQINAFKEQLNKVEIQIETAKLATTIQEAL
ncbi:MAG: hypothetical protein ACRC11_18730, partial [Xenococcaceae cyanobacterium]